jgi:hypothetical protein
MMGRAFRLTEGHCGKPPHSKALRAGWRKPDSDSTTHNEEIRSGRVGKVARAALLSWGNFRNAIASDLAEALLSPRRRPVMATTFTFQLTLLMNQRIDDLGGNWQYAGANAVETTTGQTAQLIATKRENANCCTSFPSSMLTAVVMFPSTEPDVAPNMTLQGLHDLKTNNETGSVSAASPEYADQIGGTFFFNGSTGVLTIYPPDYSPTSPVTSP